MKILAIALLAAAAVFILWGMTRTRRPLSALLLSGASGIAALFAVNLLGTLLPVDLPVNWGTIAVSTLGGVPGVIGVLVLQVV
ncbi:MAG: pro-sigmaK processing inhibitor BofA family protein [Oscillospiraceae bacterium]|nr:pro-sigmaK processing inhibitor BofA family protein [Oscillospiraceae bacterium]